MSVIISPIITNAGLGVFTPMATGIEFTFTHVAVGTGTSAVTAAATALENEIDRFPIAGGGIVTGGQAVSINALITNHTNANPQDYDITEFGFYGVDSNTNIVLFAIYRTNTTIVRKVSGADISAPFVMGLAALPTNNMTVLIDTNASAMLALLGQHTASNHPHPPYKRTLDNTERLKIADAVDNDEAVSKGQLIAVESSIPILPSIATTTVAGIVEKATQAELNSGAANVWPDAASILSGFSIDNNANGHIKLPEFLGGLVLQWGVVNVPLASTVNVNFTLPLNNFRNVQITMASSSFDQQAANYVDSVNPSGFNLTNKSPSSNADFYWLAIGK